MFQRKTRRGIVTIADAIMYPIPSLGFKSGFYAFLPNREIFFWGAFFFAAASGETTQEACDKLLERVDLHWELNSRHPFYSHDVRWSRLFPVAN